jgi:hypothetical protein
MYSFSESRIKLIKRLTQIFQSIQNIFYCTIYFSEINIISIIRDADNNEFEYQITRNNRFTSIF